MAVLDLVACPICRARESLARQTTQLESRTHVTYECRECGTQLVWLGDEMWLEADRWSFQKVGRPEKADLLFRSMTAAELRKLAGEKPPYEAPPVKPAQAIPPPVWIEMAPAAPEPPEEPPPEDHGEEAVAEQELPPARVVGAAILSRPERQAEAVQAEVEPEPEPPVMAGVVQQQEVAQESPRAAAQEPPAESSRHAAGVETAAFEQDGATPLVERQAAAEPETTAGAGVETVPAEPAARQAVAQPAVVEEAQPPGDAPEVEQPPVRSTRRRRRSRGSPFLVISVGLVLLCLICSAAAMVIYSMWERLPPGTGQPASPSASEVQAVETVLPTDTPVPTDTALPTDTPVPTPTASPVPTETAPVPAGGVDFQGVTGYLSATGSYYLVGEVINRTTDTLRFVEVLASFYDGGGQVVGSGSTFTELSIIEPGSTAPFKMTTPDLPEGWQYDLRVDYSTTGQSPIRLEVMGHSGSTADDGRYHVTGEVRNPHGFAIKFPEIVATYYNAAHEVVRVEVDFAEVDPLEPGQSSAFEVVLTDPPDDLMHYTLQTEAVEQ